MATGTASAGVAPLVEATAAPAPSLLHEKRPHLAVQQLAVSDAAVLREQRANLRQLWRFSGRAYAARVGAMPPRALFDHAVASLALWQRSCARAGSDPREHLAQGAADDCLLGDVYALVAGGAVRADAWLALFRAYASDAHRALEPDVLRCEALRRAGHLRCFTGAAPCEDAYVGVQSRVLGRADDLLDPVRLPDKVRLALCTAADGSAAADEFHAYADAELAPLLERACDANVYVSAVRRAAWLSGLLAAVLAEFRDGGRAPEPVPLRCCAVCGAAVTLSRCGRCGRACYCSREHQREDWPAHKQWCALQFAGSK
eukprot:TRINITY_DN8963_c0_g1_i1.p1 TRINITY_DN8963_c0_g1~~TRINITY_DN8963_c0_g1_i1.p1  ORF type:complete len:316 (-),score=108.79 TRINITY_DN8963_c0_g1_i1:925-1872(-)